MNHILKLYFFPTCPYCQRVLEVIKEEKREVLLIDIQKNFEGLQKLLKDTGRQTVPCLYIDEKPLFESQEIINWLLKNKQN